MLGYITRDYKNGIVYDGTNLNNVLDGEDSLRFKKENVEYREYMLVGLYGEDYVFKFPHSSADLSVKQLIEGGWKDITDEWYEKVIELSLLGYVNDYTLGAHKALTQRYYIMYKKQIGGEELYTLCERENVPLTLDATNKMGDADEDNPEPKPDIQAQNKKDGYLIMMKEAMMGYYNSDPLKYRSKGDKNEQSFDIGQTYEFQLSSEVKNSYSKTLTIEGNYTAALRYQMLNKALQEWNANPRYRMHQRNSLLQGWQKDMLKRMGRKTVALVPRRCVHEDSEILLEDLTTKKAKDIVSTDVLYGNKHIIEIGHNMKPCVKITLQDGNSIICSKEHRVPTANNFDNIKGRDLEEGNYTLAKDIKLGDFLPVYHGESIKPDFKSKDFIEGFAYGCLMGDGDRHNHYISVHDDKFRTHIVKRFGDVIHYTIPKSGYVRVSDSYNEIAKCEELKQYSYNKYIDHKNFARSNNWKWGVIEGLIATDGYFNKGKLGIEYCSTSKQLIEDFQMLLLQVGVFSNIKEKRFKSNFKSSTNNVAYTLNITNGHDMEIVLSNTDLSFKRNYDTQIKWIHNRRHQSTTNTIPLQAFKQHTKPGYYIKDSKGRYRLVFGEQQWREPRYNFQREKCEAYGLKGWLKYFWQPVVAIEDMGVLPVVDFEVDGDHTFIADNICTHNSGKTVVMTLEILKEMLAHNYKAGTRPRTVIFISKDFDAVTQVMDYIKSLMNDFDWLKTMFNYNSTDHIFSLDTYDNNGKKQTISQCKFYSALGKLPGVGDAADAVFIDEAMLVPTRVKDKLMSIVNHEGARFLAMSTFYSEDEDGIDRLYYWPIEMCNKYEKESSKILDIDNHIFKMYLDFQRSGNIPDESAGLRYTIDDVEVIIDKDGAKRELADKPENFMRELYCRLSERTTVFNYKPYIVPVRYTEFPNPMYIAGRGENEKVFKPQFKRLVTAYDPAQTGDISAFLVTGYDEVRHKVCVIKEYQLNYKDKSSFIPQANEIKEILKDLEKFKCPVLKSIDSTHQAIVDVMWSQRVFFQYLYFWIGGEGVKKGNRPSEEKVPKKLMVEALQTMFDNNKIEIWDSGCPQLIEQLDSFVEYKNDYTNRSKYEGEKGAHDDYVACLLMAVWTYWYHLGLNHNVFSIDSFKEEQMRRDEESDPMHLLEAKRPEPRYDAVENSFWR